MTFATFNRFELEILHEHALGASQPGKDAAEDVGRLVALPYIAAQLDAIGADPIREELREYGAWDAAELADDSANRQRIIWCAACNIREEINQ